MIDAQQLADRYVALWNITSRDARRNAIEELWPADGAHYVKTLEARGYDALEKRVTGSHEKNVRDGGFRFHAAPNAQRLREIVTFNWEMIRPDSGEVVSVGLEFLELGADGRIATDYQFIVS
jgi:hypothetical protein